MATKKKRDTTPPSIVSKPILAMSRGVGEFEKSSGGSWDSYRSWRSAKLEMLENKEFKTRKIVLQHQDGTQVLRFTPEEVDFWAGFFTRASEVYGKNGT